jgi:hypothetical protein
VGPTAARQSRGRGAGDREESERREPPVSREAVAAWFAGRLPDEWFEDVTVEVDRDEILVVGTLTAPEGGADAATASEAEAGRISRFREGTRHERIAIALEAEGRYGRKVSWGARAGSTRTVFTNLSVPVMTRLRLGERQVLDTLIESGVARSRSEALAWCVKLVGSRADTWLAELREAMQAVQEVREAGPAA